MKKYFFLCVAIIFNLNGIFAQFNSINSFELNPDSEYFDHLRTERQRGVWDSVEGRMNINANDFGSISNIHMATSKAGSFIRQTMFLMDSTKQKLKKLLEVVVSRNLKARLPLTTLFTPRAVTVRAKLSWKLAARSLVISLS